MKPKQTNKQILLLVVVVVAVSNLCHGQEVTQDQFLNEVKLV